MIMKRASLLTAQIIGLPHVSGGLQAGSTHNLPQKTVDSETAGRYSKFLMAYKSYFPSLLANLNLSTNCLLICFKLWSKNLYSNQCSAE